MTVRSGWTTCREGASLTVNLTDHVKDESKLEFVAGDANFDADAARQRQIIAGEDATIVFDGVTVTKAPTP